MSRMMNMPSRHKQRGAVLVITLLLLVIVLGFAVSTVNSGLIHTRMVGNSQMLGEVEAAAQEALETVLSQASSFTAGTLRTIHSDINDDGVNDYAVTVNSPTCRMVKEVTGEYSVETLKPRDTFWDIRATVTDSSSGTHVVMHQGIRMRLESGASCPEPAA